MKSPQQTVRKPSRKAQDKSGSRAPRRRQYAALPIRFDEQGRVQVLLLTSRGTRRWIIPKGWPMPKVSPAAAAAREAYEEAGLEGVIDSDTPIGSFLYSKGLDRGRRTEVEVDVFLLIVSRQLESWPEQAERGTRWCDPDEAAALVDEPGLAELLRRARDVRAPGSLSGSTHAPPSRVS